METQSRAQGEVGEGSGMTPGLMGPGQEFEFYSKHSGLVIGSLRMRDTIIPASENNHSGRCVENGVVGTDVQTGHWWGVPQGGRPRGEGQ